MLFNQRSKLLGSNVYFLAAWYATFLIELHNSLMLAYEEATNYPFDNLRYSNKYSDIIFGAIPHKGKGIDGFSSIITYLESNASEFPNVIRATNSNELNLNKTQIKNALIKTRFYKEVLEG